MERGMEKRNSDTETGLSVEGNHANNGEVQEYGATSAHAVGNDSWFQVSMVYFTSFNCGYIMVYSNLTLVPLGWLWGIICLTIMAIYTLYANWLLAGFHYIDGQRFIRYKDLMGYLFGQKFYYLTWFLQTFNLILGNMGFILLGSRALKAISSELSDDPLRLQYFVIMTGVAYCLFATLVPSITAMRRWLPITCILTATYFIILVVAMTIDGKSKTAKGRDYDIKGSQLNQISKGFGSIAALIVCHTGGLMLEVQATLRKPAVQNMRRVLYSQYTVAMAFYYTVIYVGYWAYGSAVSDYLPSNLSGAKWIKIVVNSSVFLQCVASQHTYIAPVHESLDSKFLKLDEHMHSRENLKRLICLRILFFIGNTFVAAALPFIGDFVNVFGSFSLIPITFIFPSMIFIKVKGETATPLKKLWHWFNIVLYSILCIACSTSAVRLLANNVREYHFFANK